MVPGFIGRQLMVNVYLNELPVKFSVCVNEGQHKLPFLNFIADTMT